MGGCTNDKYIRIWNYARKYLKHTILNISGYVEVIKFILDDKYLMAGNS